MSQLDIRRPVKVAIIGSGNVGATFAYALLLSGLATEIILIDSNQYRAEGEMMDLNHAVPLTKPARIMVGSYADLSGAAVVVITAGSAQKPGETRLELVARNAQIFKTIIPEIVRYNPDGILLIATNPVDILSYIAWKISGLPSQRVIGSGTILDTARFRALLSQFYGVDARSVHAYIIGEHGDSEVPVWSLANIAGMRLSVYCANNGMECRDQDLETIFHQVRDAAYEIIKRKGSTYYAISAGLVRIVEAILRDQGTILTISNYIEDFCDVNDVYLSLPCIIDRDGVERIIRLELNEAEKAGFKKSAEVIQKITRELGY
jgi:L-lactate dehydrogenase